MGASLTEKQDVIITEKTIVVPETIERPSLTYNFYKNPIVKGNVVRISIFVNEKEIHTLKYECTEDIEKGCENQPYIHFQPVIRKIVTDTIEE